MDAKIPLIDRDISWLHFNGRVLEEAADLNLPLYERIKFLAIYSSNLDEFYRVRVASIRSLQRINKKKLNKKFSIKPGKLLQKINEIVLDQQNTFGKIFSQDIRPELETNGIILVYHSTDIPKALQKELTSYFKSRVLSYLQPIILRQNTNTFLTNQNIYLVVKLLSKSTQEIHYAVLNVPSALSRFYHTRYKGIQYHIFLDDIIRLNMEIIFPGYKLSESFSVKLNRDADLYIEDEYSGDLVQKLKDQLTKRNIGPSSRFLYDSSMPEDILSAVLIASEIEEDEVVEGGRYHNLNDLMSLPSPPGNSLKSKEWPSIKKLELEESESIFKMVASQDVLLNFPYHSYDYVLQFFNEAVVDPNVKEIKATFYRVASDSFIVNALISAARNGKKVQAFIEVKARFDEENNLKWAGKMEEAGVRITYSLPGLKVHAKAALIKRQDSNGRLQNYAFLGTGNFNEKTAGIYADHGLLTSDRTLTMELDRVFKYLYGRIQPRPFKNLLVSQFNMDTRFIELIDREIQHVTEGKKAEILIKLNNLEDPIMISKLYEASIAGVQIRLIVRGICCLRPGEEPHSTNIKAYRLVDRYLEHARVFHFHNDGNDEMFLGSADWMRRNLYSRIEVIFPIKDALIKKEIQTMIAFQLNDNTKVRCIDNNGANMRVLGKNGARGIRAQKDFYQWLAKKERQLLPQ